MIIFKEYEIEDWSKIDDPVEPFSSIPTKNFLEITKNNSVAATALKSGNVMACGGISYTNDNEGIVWVKVSKKCLSQSYRWARTIREAFVLMMDSVGYLKISTYILDNFCKGERLAKLIGLRKSGETKEYKGKTYNRYVVT